jgi:imidazolonepropionase
LLRGAKQLLTLRGPAGARRGAALRELAVIEDGSLLIHNGKITHVGSTRRIENLKQAREAIEVSANGRVAMPGFVDSSLNVRLESGADDDSPKRRKKPAELHAEAVELLRNCLQHGTLAAELKASAEAGDFRSDLAVLRQLSRIGKQPVDVRTTWRISGAVAAGGDFLQTLETVARRKLADFVEIEPFLGCSPSEKLLAQIGALRLPLKLSWPGGSADALSELVDRIQPRTVFCSQPLSAEECRVLAGSPAVAVFSPGQHALDGVVASSARELADAGGAIVLSSGYDSRYTPSFSMQMVVALAVFRLRLSAEEAISAATINAAYASGCGEAVGSLESGKRANLLVLDISDYRDLPRQFGVNHVAMAIQDGAIIFNRNRWKAGAA